MPSRAGSTGIMVCPDGIVIVTWILCYLSEVVVLKLASAVLYLECRPLDMHWCTGLNRRQNRTAAEIRGGIWI